MKEFLWTSASFILDQPPPKSFWVILRLVFFFFAIEFMYAVETALTVPILSSLRVPESYVISRIFKFHFSNIFRIKIFFNGMVNKSNSWFFSSTNYWYVE